MTTGSSDRRSAHTLALLALVVLASILRFWRLGDWSLGGDEIFTFRDSLNPKLTNPRPLIYFLNHYVVGRFIPLDEFGLRLLPAIFGVLAIPAVYLVGRRIVGSRAALFAAFLLTVNPLHVYYSQTARYWSLVVLLSAIYPFAIYLGFRDRDGRALAVGLVTAVLAALAHPVSVLLLGGLGLWLLVVQQRRDYLAQLWTHRSIRWGGLLLVVLVAVTAIRYIPLLRSWIFVRPAVQARDYLLHSRSGFLVKQAGLLLSYVEGLTVPLVLTAAVGIYLLWRGRERQLALLLICLVAFPLAFIVLLSFRTAVGRTYVLSTAPIFFIGAGVFLGHLAEVPGEVRPRWLPAATVAIVVALMGAPTLISQYLDGRRYDFRTAATWLDARVQPQDMVFSDQLPTMAHYLKGAKARQLVADSTVLGQSVRTLQQEDRGGGLWIVAPYSARGSHRTNPTLGRFKSWVYDNCQLRNVIGVARLDYRVNELQIFHCVPGTPPPGHSPPS